jgi:tartrate dehydratase alpha subunit/fumarate hydratase class I-like protein
MEELEKLKKENEDLKTKLIDLLFEANYNKQTELIEFIRNLYESLEMKEIKKIPKKELLMNLKHSIEEFARINKINLK